MAIPIKTSLDKSRHPKGRPSFGQRIKRNSPMANLQTGSTPASTAGSDNPAGKRPEPDGGVGNSGTPGKRAGRRNVDDMYGRDVFSPNWQVAGSGRSGNSGTGR
jgi:hypothetical protein